MAYNGHKFDFPVLKKQASEYAVESDMEAWTERNTGTRSHSGVGYIKYEKYNIFYRFIRRFFATTKIGRRNQENGWEPQGFARTARRPRNALALMVTLWQGRPAKLQSTLTRSLASVDSNWIKTLRLQSNGTKSCDFLNGIKGIIFTQTLTPDIQLEFHFYTASKALDIYIK